MKINNIFNSSKKIFAILSLVLSISALSLIGPSVFADHGSEFRVENITAASNILTFRDSTSVLLQSHTLTLDQFGIQS